MMLLRSALAFLVVLPAVFAKRKHTKKSTSPSASPSDSPSESPSDVPSTLSSTSPSASPSDSPSESPSDVPSPLPSTSPSDTPSTSPSLSPSDSPSDSPSESPSDAPSTSPSSSPSASPSDSPSESPSDVPSTLPSTSPSDVPSTSPSSSPSASPSESPSDAPSTSPSSSPKAIREAFVLEDDKTSISMAVDFFAILEFFEEMQQYNEKMQQYNICCKKPSLVHVDQLVNEQPLTDYAMLVNEQSMTDYAMTGKDRPLAATAVHSGTYVGDTSLEFSLAEHTPFEWMMMGGGMMGGEIDLDCDTVICPYDKIADNLSTYDSQKYKTTNLRGGKSVDKAAGFNEVLSNSSDSAWAAPNRPQNFTGEFDIGGTQIISTGSVRKLVDKDLGNVTILDNNGNPVDVSQFIPELDTWTQEKLPNQYISQEKLPIPYNLNITGEEKLPIQNISQYNLNMTGWPNQGWLVEEEGSKNKGNFFSDACTVIEGEIDFINDKMFKIEKQKCDIDVCVGTNKDTGVPDCFNLRFSGKRSANIDILPTGLENYATAKKESLNSVTASLIGGTGRFAMAQGQATFVVVKQRDLWEPTRGPTRDTIMVFIKYFGYDFGDEW